MFTFVAAAASSHKESEYVHWRIPGFVTVPVSLDGNCMFASIAHQLHFLGRDPQQRSAAAVRQELVEYIRLSSDMHSVLSSALDVSDSLEQYLSRMAQDGTWGDGNILSAAYRLYHYPVHVFTEDAQVPTVIGDSNAIMLAWTRVTQ